MSTTREYLANKNIGSLFEILLKQVVDRKPDNPVQFLIKLLQEKGEALLSAPTTSGFGCDGPCYRGRKSNELDCEGQALDIRKSIERYLPKSVDSSPLKKSENVIATTDDVQSTEAGHKTIGLSTSTDEPQTSTESSAVPPIVSQECVTAVQSIFNFGKRKTSTTSTASSKTVTSEKEEKTKKSKEKKSSMEDKSESEDERKSNSSYENLSDKNDEEKKEEAKEALISKDSEDVTEGKKLGGGVLEKEESKEERVKEESEEERVKEESEEEGVEEEGKEETGSIIQTMSCDLTDVASWRDGELEVISIVSEHGNSVRQSTFRKVNSAVPVRQIYPYQSEDVELREEVFTNKTIVGEVHNKPAARITSPCNTVFFEEPDTEPPVITEPAQLVAVFRAPRDGSLRNVLKKKKNSGSDKLSVSELSGCGWTYAESVS